VHVFWFKVPTPQLMVGHTHWPLEQLPLQHGSPAAQEPPFDRHVAHLPLSQRSPLQHCSSLVQCLPLRLQPGGSAAASPPRPSDASVPPTRAAPINLRALPRVRVPSASPLARSSKKPSS
jgi:hypothetical protein